MLEVIEEHRIMNKNQFGFLTDTVLSLTESINKLVGQNEAFNCKGQNLGRNCKVSYG